MSANFEYKIKANDQSKRGLSGATKGLDNLGKTTKRVSNMMKAAIAGVSLVGIIKGTGKLLDLYGEQEKVEKRLAQAIQNNPYLDGSAAERMTAYASALQKTSTFGDELIIQQQSMLASMGLTEQQINATTNAAVQLASSGVMSLESATRNLAKTYSGMAGELGESIPAMRELTAEQLKAGDAVDLIAEKYAGMGQQMTQGNEGAKAQFKNMMGDIGEIAGSTLAPAFRGLLDDLTPVMENFGQWLEDNAVYITNIFSNIPELASLAFEAVSESLSAIFSVDYLKSLGSALWEFFLQAGQAALSFLADALTAIGKTLWAPLELGFEWVIYGIKSLFANVINFFIDKLNALAEGAHDLGQKIAHPLDKSKRDTFTGGIAKIFEDLEKPVNKMGADVKAAWEGVGGSFKDMVVNIAEAGKGLGAAAAKPIKDAFTAVAPELKKIIFAPAKPGMESSLAPGAGGDGTGTGNFGPAVFSGGGGGGSAAAGAAVGEALGETGRQLADVFGKIAGGVGEFFSKIQSVSAVFNPLQTILTTMLDILGPAIDGVMAPLLGVLLEVGRTLAEALMPIIVALMPVVEALAKAFVWMYNEILQPVGNLLLKVIGFVANGIIGVVNGIITGINSFFGTTLSTVAYVNTKALALGKISYEKAAAAGTAAVTTGDYGFGNGTSATEGGAAAQYTAGRNITQNVTINTDVIAGEGGIRELAVLIRDEIYAAEALGA